MPDLLNAFGVVNARNLSDTYIVVVGPSKVPPKLVRPVRHEYLHFLIDPLVRKYEGYLPEAGPFLKKAGERPAVTKSFAERFPLMVAESLIRILELRLDTYREGEEEGRIIDEYDKGLILSPYFAAALSEFEGREGSIEEFFPELIEGITWEREKYRVGAIEKLRVELASRQATLAADRESRRQQASKIQSLLRRANILLLEKSFTEAEMLLQEVLHIDALNASALFGMAQVAGQRQDIERALDLYAQAADQAGNNTWIAGWSRLFRGNLYRLIGDLDRAKTEWELVLQLEGDLRGAEKEAARALAKQP